MHIMMKISRFILCFVFFAYINAGFAQDVGHHKFLSYYEEQLLQKIDDNLTERLYENRGKYISETPSSLPSAPVASCNSTNPHIPQGQKIPVGSPVLPEHFVYCSYYGKRFPPFCSVHPGYDIGCVPEMFNRPVFATADGIVGLVVQNYPYSPSGNAIVINHDNGFQTKYMHLENMYVTPGQFVKAGCQIATVGHTGGSTDQVYPNMPINMSHLHYEIHYTGTANSVTVEMPRPQLPIKLAITRGFPNATGNDEWAKTSIDPTQFICAYTPFEYGYCGKTYPYDTTCP